MELQQAIFSQLPGALLPWYGQNKRGLPWRSSHDPYRIWISEIMLQQTRVEAVKGYYVRFLNALPTVGALASADDDVLHKLWEGLGYYSRVRNLKKAAQVLVADYGGSFPREHDLVLALPGIGPYTAGAICSIAFGLPTPAVDGNVLRVASRLTDDPTPIDKPAYRAAVQSALAQVYPPDAGSFTQALMELGATLCGPNRKPECGLCPCRNFCLGHRHGTAAQLPVKQPKKQRRRETLTVFILSCGGRYALRKRPDRGLLAGLWEFPHVPDKLTVSDAIGVLEEMELNPKEIYRQVERNHIFTHVEWDMNGIYVEVSQEAGDFCWLTAEEIRQQAALPTAFRQFWDIRESGRQHPR